jgi:hypothetical protein
MNNIHTFYFRQFGLTLPLQRLPKEPTILWSKTKNRIRIKKSNSNCKKKTLCTAGNSYLKGHKH